MTTTGTITADVILADSVGGEGKLNLLGAGWDVIFAQAFPARHSRLGVGVLVHVPYTATNHEHKWSLRIEDQDGTPIALADAPPGNEGDNPEGKRLELAGAFNIGRPPFLPAGADQTVVLAMNLDGLVFHKPDFYNVVFAVDGTDLQSATFGVQLPPVPLTVT